jgi:hypothetical protein
MVLSQLIFTELNALRIHASSECWSTIQERFSQGHVPDSVGRLAASQPLRLASDIACISKAERDRPSEPGRLKTGSGPRHAALLGRHAVFIVIIVALHE